MNNIDDGFRRELMAMWQQEAPAGTGDPAILTRRLSLALKTFDQKIFWRNAIEYGAAFIVLIRSFYDMAYGDRLLIAPLTSMAVALFISYNIWRKHRLAAPVDPTADAHSYRVALLDRIDRQIQFSRGVRYWYVLPAWIFFVTVLISGIVKGLPTGQLLAQFGIVSALCVFVIWLNERYGARRLQAERDQVYSTFVDSTLRWTTSSVFKMQYELKVGEEVVGTLKFRNLLGTLAEAKSSEGCWTFKRVGFWKTQAKVRVCGSETDIATFKHNTWKGGGSLTLAGGRELRATSNLWMTRLEIQEMTGTCLVRLRIRGMTQMSADVEIQPAAQNLPETPWLVMFCWYLFVMMQNDVGTVGGGGGS